VKWVRKLIADCELYDVRILSMAHGTELLGKQVIQESLNDVICHQI
jgi:hypothetical protein